jgi:hypothetical protein
VSPRLDGRPGRSAAAPAPGVFNPEIIGEVARVVAGFTRVTSLSLTHGPGDDEAPFLLLTGVRDGATVTVRAEWPRTGGVDCAVRCDVHPVRGRRPGGRWVRTGRATVLRGVLATWVSDEWSALDREIRESR